jgi:hypothetical protein
MLDFSKLDPSSVGDGTAVKLPSGVYPVTVKETKETATKNGKPQIEFKVQINDAKFGNPVRTIWIGCSSGPDDKVQWVWIRAFQSIGVTPEQLKGIGQMPEAAAAASFVGRAAYIEWTDGNQDLNQSPNCEFITAAAYKQKAEAIAAALAKGEAPPQTRAQASSAASGNAAPAASAASVPAASPAFTASIPTGSAPTVAAPGGLAGLFAGGGVPAPSVAPPVIAPAPAGGGSMDLAALLGPR